MKNIMKKNISGRLMTRILAPVLLVLVLFACVCYVGINATSDGYLRSNAERSVHQAVADVLRTGQPGTEKATAPMDHDPNTSNPSFEIQRVLVDADGTVVAHTAGKKYSEEFETEILQLLEAGNISGKPTEFSIAGRNYMVASCTVPEANKPTQQNNLSAQSNSAQHSNSSVQSNSAPQSNSAQQTNPAAKSNPAQIDASAQTLIVYQEIPEGSRVLGRMGKLILEITLLFFALAVVLVWFIARNIARPIEELCKKTAAIGEESARSTLTQTEKLSAVGDDKNRTITERNQKLEGLVNHREDAGRKHYTITELEALNASISDMADRIDRNQAELRAQAETLTVQRDQLRVQTETLEQQKHQLVVQTKTLEEQQKELIENQRVKERIFQNISHDLRTPLVSIIGYADGISRGAVENKEEAAGVILREGRRMQRMLESSLTLTKLNNGGWKLQLMEVPVEELIAEQVEALKKYAPEKRLVFLNEAEDREEKLEGKEVYGNLMVPDLTRNDADDRHENEEIILRTDPDLLIRIFGNIVSDCLRYAESTVEVSVREVSTNKKASLEAGGQKELEEMDVAQKEVLRKDKNLEGASDVVITVKDDGPGIAEEDLPHIFEEYYKGKDGSFGIGLSVVSSGVRLVGGTVRAYNQTAPSHGAVYEVRLPKS